MSKICGILAGALLWMLAKIRTKEQNEWPWTWAYLCTKPAFFSCTISSGVGLPMANICHPSHQPRFNLEVTL